MPTISEDSFLKLLQESACNKLHGHMLLQETLGSCFFFFLIKIGYVICRAQYKMKTAPFSKNQGKSVVT